MSAVKEKEFADVLLLVVAIAQFVKRELAGDGLQTTDLIKLAASREFQSRFVEAIAGVGDIPKEFSGITALDGVDLAIFALTAAREVMSDQERAA
jgi:hypothetical protein